MREWNLLCFGCVAIHKQESNPSKDENANPLNDKEESVNFTAYWWSIESAAGDILRCWPRFFRPPLPPRWMSENYPGWWVGLWLVSERSKNLSGWLVKASVRLAGRRHWH